MELSLVTGKDGKKRLWGARSGGVPVDSFDPALNVEISAPTAGDPTANTAEDASGVTVVGGRIYLVTSVGGSPRTDNPCVSPSNDLYGCFRMQIAEATRPLAPRAAGTPPLFNRSVLVSPLPPFNPGEYRHVITDPTVPAGRLAYFILGAFLPVPSSYPYPISQPLANQSNVLPAGLLRFPIGLDQLRFRPPIEGATRP
jgi:hypothetical protein